MNESHKGTLQSEMETEARYWNAVDADLTRRVSWCSIRHFEMQAVQRVTDGAPDLLQFIRPMIRPGHRALVLGAGDLQGEYPWLKGLGSAHVDSFDVSEESFRRFQLRVPNPGMHVDLHLQDVNQIQLPPRAYQFAVVVHSFHHFHDLERVSAQVSNALTDDGIFLVFDYIGPNRLQFSPRQLAIAEPIFRSLPPQYRRDCTGAVREKIFVSDPAMLSPFEAARSQEIVEIWDRYFCVREGQGILYGGLLYPLFEGIAFNFDESREWDRWFVRSMWELDNSVCSSGLIEPSFCILVLRPKR